MELIVRNANVLSFEVSAVVAPTSTRALMSDGPAALIRQQGGAIIEQEILKVAPFAIGAAAVTTAGNLSCARHVIHVPNRKTETDSARIEHIRLSVRAALVAAHRMGFESITIPGPGPCSSNIHPRELARAVVDEIRIFKDTPPSLVYLVDTSPEIVKAFEHFTNPTK